MSDLPERTSAAAKQLARDVETVEAEGGGWAWLWMGWYQLTTDIHRERKKTRVLTHYVAYLLDRVENLERRLDEQQKS